MVFVLLNDFNYLSFTENLSLRLLFTHRHVLWVVLF